jgi:hypothetical protein
MFTKQEKKIVFTILPTILIFMVVAFILITTSISRTDKQFKEFSKSFPILSYEDEINSTIIVIDSFKCASCRYTPSVVFLKLGNHRNFRINTIENYNHSGDNIANIIGIEDKIVKRENDSIIYIIKQKHPAIELDTFLFILKY